MKDKSKYILLLAAFLVLMATFLFLFHDWLTYNSDALMVIITFVYVIATTEICRANIKSAEATKAQLDEMKKQYDEDNRPNIELEFAYENRTVYVARFVNNGKRAAQHVKIQLAQEFINSLPIAPIRSMIEKQKTKECIIGAGQHYDLFIGDNKLRYNPNILPLTGTVSYQADGKTYTSDLYIDIENYMTFFSINDEHDDIIKILNNGTNELKNIRASIETLRPDRNEEKQNV